MALSSGWDGVTVGYCRGTRYESVRKGVRNSLDQFTEAQCLPLTTSLGRALHEHYGLDDLPDVYLNGKPLPESPLNEEGSTS